MSEKLNLLVTGAHPADAFDAVGGTIAKHTARGDNVTVGICTIGVKSHGWWLMAEERKGKKSATEEQIREHVKVKEDEVREGLAILGVKDVRFFDWDDAVLVMDPKLVWKMAELIREVRPHIIITHSPLEQDGIPDQHALCGQITLSAIRLAAGVMPDYPKPPCGVMRVYFEGAGGKTTNIEYERNRFPHILIDVEDVVEKKIKAIDKLKSQFYDGALGRKMSEARSFIWGLHQRLPYVEAFQMFEPLVMDSLPVCDYDFERAKTPFEQQYRHSGKMIAPFIEQDE